MIIQVAVTRNDFFKNWKRPFTIIKQAYQLNQEAMALKFYPGTTHLSKALCFKGLLNRNKVDWMVSKYLSSYNSHQFKNFSENQFWYLVMPTG